MNPALRTTLHAFGFAIGFCMLLSGGAGLAGLVLALAHAEMPSFPGLLATAVFLAVPLLAFRAYDRTKVTVD